VGHDRQDPDDAELIGKLGREILSSLSASENPIVAPRGGHRADPWPWLMLVAVVVASAVIGAMIVGIFWLSFREGMPGQPGGLYSLVNYATVLDDPRARPAIVNTFKFAFTALAVALACGLPTAWLAERSDFRGRNALFTLMTMGVLVPGFATSMGWLFLLHPRIGIVNAWLQLLFGPDAPVIDVTTIWGMGFIEGISLSPVAFIMAASVFRAMDPALEDAASMSGANFRQTMFRVTLRVAFPGILAAAIYIFTIGFAAFDVPVIIGWASRRLTFSTLLLLLLSGEDALPRYGAAAAISTLALVLAVALSVWYAAVQRQSHRYEIVTGKAYRPRLVELGRTGIVAWLAVGAYFALGFILPSVTLIWASFMPFFRPPSAAAFAAMSLQHYRALPWDLVIAGMKNTAILMALTPTVALALSVAFSWIVLRSRFPGRQWFDVFAFLPHAIPSVIFGMGALLAALYVVDKVVPIYGTVWLLLLVFVIARLSYGTRVTNGGMIQIHRELGEAATVSGADTGATLRRIVLPLLAPTLVYAWLWIALLTFRELTLAAFLTTKDNLTLPVVIWSMWQGGTSGPAAALSVLLLLLMAPVVALYWFIGRRRVAALN
jgi:iron(III) transport system permease protein